ncbi:hypothetical protein FGO68_gene15908 [Halteria grandinella]|uniref:Uncharacterized protein n=1 Tax=Halteria grandinella TaxID=5974 RepID=A0A8J8NDY1_HALGN|nr:hypothetical protein FGO68_gene15908 [Halteria grandinella]
MSDSNFTSEFSSQIQSSVKASFMISHIYIKVQFRVDVIFSVSTSSVVISSQPPAQFLFLIFMIQLPGGQSLIFEFPSASLKSVILISSQFLFFQQPSSMLVKTSGVSMSRALVFKFQWLKLRMFIVRQIPKPTTMKRSNKAAMMLQLFQLLQ